MRYVYSISDDDELIKYKKFAKEHENIINKYIDDISAKYRVTELPKYIVLSNFDMATEVHANIIIPAYTNETRMIVTPELAVWKNIYLQQTDTYSADDRVQCVRNYYEHTISEKIILQIIGHELAHQSELFLNNFDEEASGDLWYEEGMVEYISRKFFLTENEFAEEKKINRLLVELFEEHHTVESIENFGRSTYDGSYASIFYEYWRSFLIIDHLVNKLGSVENVFKAYHEWNQQGRIISLTKWFGIE